VTVRVGVVGVGNIGSSHALNLARVVSGSAVSVLFDADPDRAAALAADLGARSVRTVPELFDADDVDAAVKILSRRRSAKVARDVGIDTRRAGTVLAGALLLGEASRTLGHPLTLGRGGIREGAALALGRPLAADAA